LPWSSKSGKDIITKLNRQSQESDQKMNIQKQEEELINHLVQAEKEITQKGQTKNFQTATWLETNRKIIAERKRFVKNLHRAELRAKVRRLRNQLDKMKKD